MKSVIIIAFGLFLIGPLLGCGSGYPTVPVSGTVTVDGKPEGGIKLYFTPVAIEGEINSGPYSTAITDENGSFVLETRNGDPGAVAGKHRAVLSYADPGSAGKTLTTPDAEEVRKEALKRRKARGLTQREEEATPVRIEVEVPSDGTDALKFEVLSRKIK